MAALTLGLVQTNPGQDKAENVSKALRWIAEAAERGAQFVALPETFHCRGPNEVKFATAETIPGPLSERLAEVAARHRIYLLAGSFNERVETDDDPRLFNTSLLFGPDGGMLAAYRKIHLFDAVIEGKVGAQESSRNRPGDCIVTADTAFGTVGLSICYDLRFPELYRALALRGATMMFVPSNFTLHTGRDHWEVLLRARAIENGAFVIAPATIGSAGGGFQAYGRSMVVDPWGIVLACAPDEEGVILATIDLERVQQVRDNLPSLQHLRPDVYGLPLAGS
jgi:predicted amidohydrolase